MLLLGIDIGTSSIKVAVVSAETRQCIASAQYPETETAITALQTGWAEQSPEMWWQHTINAINKVNAGKTFDPHRISAIGISYQMHGLVLVDKKQNVLRDSIIWCDSRAVEIGDNALAGIGADTCSSCLLNSPGNFTASKLAWVKKHEAEIYKSIDKMMLPGDYIGMKLSGNITTTSSALSEGIFWDFKKEEISKNIMEYYGFESSQIPNVQPLFSSHGYLSSEAALQLSLKEGIPITYKAGDQLNNALSLNVLQPGEVAATAGTSGVIYAVTDTLLADKFSRVNAFAHVNHKADEKRIGILLCINGTGIMNSWIKKLCADNESYEEINARAATVEPGSNGLYVLPFGNGAERVFENKIIGSHIGNIDFNKHSKPHIFRAVQEGIAFAFRYGLDIMRENGLSPTIIRASKANLFLSNVFVESFVNATGVAIELYENDGSVGAALGAGIGAGMYPSYEDAFINFRPLNKVVPTKTVLYNELYEGWKKMLQQHVESEK